MSNEWSRRDFLKTASAATLGALAAGYPCAMWAAEEEKIKPTADTVIVLWMAGGMAHTETFDPKRYTPYEKGLESNRVLSTFPAIDTAVDNIKVSQGLENIAKVMDRATLIRSYTAGDLGFILHSRHQYQWHTGYAPPQTVAAPHLGAFIARTLGPLNPAVPAFIDIGQRFDLGEGEELKAFHTAGFLGSEYGPFAISNPEQAVQSVRPPAGMSPSRFENRDKFYRKLMAKSPIMEYGSDYQQQSLLRSMDNAHRLLSSPASKAFDLSLEPKESYDKYNTGKFGLGCLLARRLTEVGARFIEVTTEYIPFVNWDTHENGHTRLVDLKKSIDAPIAQLVLDLEKRGLLDRTLIVLASEFSRDMMMEGKPENLVKNQVVVPDVINDMKYYGMHRHFTDAGSVLMFGGGMKKGYLHGKTADERPCTTVEKRVVIEDLHASIYRAVGISPKLSYDIEKRPFYVTKDGKGKPVMDLFA
ncbi:DUF1501 domain-containing protein [Pedosphaera parvula]|uniref:DUF1501 domain-containing protein n=1 Tax=Pedosphaera parvula (strain Ellin514) TaxID=320771 RepID=B9XIM9_PEDPL|nr:DUF1501 domain-containing protein [Pedosphaera parvula]EEF60292.1 protein of unknown function DUF1501 [Pedosphaera parvula Ellin514]